MKDKFTTLRDCILDDIEQNIYPDNCKLPGSRELARRYNASMILVQGVIGSLEQDGVVECIPRSGTYVRPEWRQRLIRNHLIIFRPELFWVDSFRTLLGQHLPQLRLCRQGGFNIGMFEIRSTIELLRDRDQFIDLQPFLPPDIDDDQRYFTRAFSCFRDSNGRRFGLPIIFSPRIMLYNPGLLTAIGLSPPTSYWTWDEFITYVKKLRQHYPAERVLNYSDSLFYWMSFILRSRGSLFRRRSDGLLDVCFDTPESIHGIELIRELRQALQLNSVIYSEKEASFITGDQVFALGEREFCSRVRHAKLTNWESVPLPIITGGNDEMAQSTNLLCIRRECTDKALAAKLVHFMLSYEVQSFFGQARYGIPVLKKAAMESIDPEDPRDTLFLSLISKMSADYNIDSPFLAKILLADLERIITTPQIAVDKELKTLAEAFRVFIRINNNLILRERKSEQKAIITVKGDKYDYVMG